MEIPSEHVDQYYQMNPAEDDLLPNASHLRPGMIVLIEAPHLRGDATLAEASLHDKNRYDEKNRWAKISHLETNGHRLIFVAEYADGMKVKRVAPISDSWLVKKESVV